MVDRCSLHSSTFFVSFSFPFQHSQCSGRYDHRHASVSVEKSFLGAYEFLIKKNTGRHIDVSRLYMYYNARRKDGLQPYNMQDIGCTIKSAIAALAQNGSCNEKMFPYEPYLVNREPSSACYASGRKYRLSRAERVNANVNEMKACLAEGFPFVFGLQTFQSFARAQTNGGVVYMPQPGEKMNASHGWHAMLAAGYLDAHRVFIVRNSWGQHWVRLFSFSLSFNHGYVSRATKVTVTFRTST